MAETSNKSDVTDTKDEFTEITLRQIKLSDVDDFMEWAADEKVSQFCTWDAYTSKDEFTEITLRQIELSDVDDFMEWAADEKVSQFCTWDAYTSKDQALDFINKIAIPHPWLRAICLKNRAIGSISVTPNSGCFDSCRAELGYVLAYKYWGKGIVTEAVKIVVSKIFSEWPNLERVEALVDIDNKGSQRVLEKAGFLKEGVLRKFKNIKGRSRDEVIYSFLCTDAQYN